MFYSLQNRWRYASFARRTRQIDTTPPIACDPNGSCEVHTMLGRADVPLYKLAIKSLLRWYPGVAVIVHSDGTLDEMITSSLKRHVPGLRLIEAAEADARAAQVLRERPILARWRAHDAAYRRLIDTCIWNQTPRRIVLDADVIVLKEPKEVGRWIEAGRTAFMLGQAPDDGDQPPAPGPSAHVQAHFRHAVPRIAEATSMPARFLQGTTAGFHGCLDEISFDKIERLLVACEALGLPMTQWGGDQCAVIYLLSAAGAVRLNEERCFNFDPSRVEACRSAEIIHFFGTNRFHRGIYADLASDLCRALVS